MKILSHEALDEFFVTVCCEFDLHIPVISPDGARVLGRPGEGRTALAGGALLAKPTALFFPQEEEIFTYCPEGLTRSLKITKPLLVAAFTPKDLLCLSFIDNFFAEGLRDDLYFSRRQGAIIAAVSGYSGAGGEFVPMSEGDCDLEFVFDGSDWIVVSYSQEGELITALMACDAPSDALSAVIRRSAEFADEDAELILAASEILMADKVPDSFWEEISVSCILCTGCNLVCPTCTCFGVQDWRYTDRVERKRMWDSCQLDGFAREAGGHNPLGTEALRTRRRIHHKLATDRIKWGKISCFVCGRCDAVCPTGIGIVAVARLMVARFG